MTNETQDVRLDIHLPAPEAADLTSKAAAKGLSTPEFLGYHALRSAYGVLHPRVAEIEAKDVLGRAGTDSSKG